MEKTKEISRKEIVGLKITRCIGMISFHLGTWMCIFNFLIGNTYNFASDTIKVLDRTSFALVETGLCAFLVSLLFEICLNRKGIHLGEREREPMKKSIIYWKIFSLCILVFWQRLGQLLGFSSSPDKEYVVLKCYTI